MTSPDSSLPSADELYHAGSDHARSGKEAAAVEAFTQALERDPRHGKARLARAMAFQRMGNPIAATTDCDYAIQNLPEWEAIFVAHYTRAMCRYAGGEFEAAINDCSEVLVRHPQHNDALYLRCTSFKALGEMESALEDVNAILQSDSEYTEAYHVRASLFYRGGHWDQAIADFSDYLDRIPPSSPQAQDALRLRAAARLEMEDHANALLDLNLLLERFPGDRLAYLRRSQVHRALGMDSQADEDLRRVSGES